METCLKIFGQYLVMIDNKNLPNPQNLPFEIGGEIPLIEKAELTIQQYETQIMAIPNVIGFGYGEREASPGTRSLQVFVTRKVPANRLNAQSLIPKTIGDFATDVIEVGVVVAQGQPLSDRIRPIKGGYSVGHPNITAGTIATACYDLLENATVQPPSHGIGIPKRYYILSNNHVLADSNNARLGDVILQPGPFDGGRNPQDAVGILRRYVPITFNPPVPLEQHNNLVDCAIAEVEFNEVERQVYWLDTIVGWRPRMFVLPGSIIMKTGRTTGFTTGRIISVNATIDVGYGGGRVARFRDQIITTGISAGGDSGSLICSTDKVAVGLLFAGSPVITVCNHIENVRSLLRIEVAESIRALPSLDVIDLESVKKLLISK